jgi:predicted nucleic-acid-binding protein
MISVDTSVIVRLLTGDDPLQFERSKTLFSTDNIFIPTSVVLECEWVLRYAYSFKPPEITIAFQSLFGLPNVHLENSSEISNAIEWHQNKMDFTYAIHLALSKEAKAFITFDKSLIIAVQNILPSLYKCPNGRSQRAHGPRAALTTEVRQYFVLVIEELYSYLTSICNRTALYSSNRMIKQKLYTPSNCLHHWRGKEQGFRIL